MSPPSFYDLGKYVHNLFNAGFYFSTFRLNVKTYSVTGVQFITSGETNSDTQKTIGSLETRYTALDKGIVFSEKWNTDNVIHSELSIEDQIAAGVNLKFIASFSPLTGKKMASLKSVYKTSQIHANTNIDFDMAGPLLNGAIVFGLKNWYIGYKYVFNTAKSAFVNNNLALAYEARDFYIHTTVEDASEVTGNLFHRINDKLHTGIQLVWNSNSSKTMLSFAASYELDPALRVKAKVNNACQIGLSLSHILRPGISLTLCALIDGKNVSTGGHKMGAGLDIEC